MAVIRKFEMSALLNSFIMTEIQLKSTGQLNLNFTESLIEVLFELLYCVFARSTLDLNEFNSITLFLYILNVIQSKICNFKSEI